MGIEIAYLNGLHENLSVELVIRNTVKKHENDIIEDYGVDALVVDYHDGKTTIFFDNEGRQWFSRYGKFIVCEETPVGRNAGHLMCMDNHCSCKDLIYYEEF